MGSGESDELLQNLLVLQVEVPGNKVFFVTGRFLAALWCFPEGFTPGFSSRGIYFGSVRDVEQLLS